MEKYIRKTQNVNYGEDGYVEIEYEKYFMYPPEISKTTIEQLDKELENYFYSMTSNMDEKGLIRQNFIFPAVLTQRIKTTEFNYSLCDNCVRRSDITRENYYFPTSLKEASMNKLKEMAEQNNYHIKTYYSDEYYNSVTIINGNPTYQPHQLTTFLYTKKAFLESFKRELTNFAKNYNICFGNEECRGDLLDVTYDLSMEGHFNELNRLLDYYEAISEKSDILNEFGITVDEDKKEIQLTKVKQ